MFAGGAGVAGGDALCATLYAGGWALDSVSGFRNFHCGSILVTVRHRMENAWMENVWMEDMSMEDMSMEDMSMEDRFDGG